MSTIYNSYMSLFFLDSLPLVSLACTSMYCMFFNCLCTYLYERHDGLKKHLSAARYGTSWDATDVSHEKEEKMCVCGEGAHVEPYDARKSNLHNITLKIIITFTIIFPLILNKVNSYFTKLHNNFYFFLV